MAQNNKLLNVGYVADQSREGSFIDKAMKITGVLESGLPHASDLEFAVIGGLLVDMKAFALVDFLKEKDFYLEKPRCVFNAIVALHKKSTPIDILTVVNQLKNDGLLDKKITAFDIVEMSNSVVSHANIVHHARILEEFRLKRQTIVTAQQLLQDVLKNKTSIYDLRNSALAQLRTTPSVDLFIAKTAAQSIEDARTAESRKCYAGAFLKEREVVFLFGDTGSGKSVFAVQLAQAIATGTDLFPFVKNEVGPTKVLYYDFEVDDIGFAQRYDNSEDVPDKQSDDYRYFQFHDNFIRVTLDDNYLDFEEDAES
jgi:replicative DNA helicase